MLKERNEKMIDCPPRRIKLIDPNGIKLSESIPRDEMIDGQKEKNKMNCKKLVMLILFS